MTVEAVVHRSFFRRVPVASVSGVRAPALVPLPRPPGTEPFGDHATIAEMAMAIDRRRPHLRDTINRYGHYTLVEYSRLLSNGSRSGHPVFDDRRDCLAAVLGRTAAETAEHVLATGAVGTTGHFSATTADVEVSAQVVRGLHHLLAGDVVEVPYYGTGHVSGKEQWNVRGGVILSHTNNEGDRIELPLFPGRFKSNGAERWDMGSTTITHYPPFTQAMIDTLMNGPVNGLTSANNRYSPDPILPKAQGRAFREHLRAMYEAGVSEETFERQMELVNDYLWDHLFADPVATKTRTRLAEPMTEGSFREALGQDRAGWLGKVVFDPQWRRDLLAAMEGVEYLWGTDDTGAFKGSHLFRTFNARGELENLRVEGKNLVSVRNPDHRIPLEPTVICDLLREKRLAFTLFLQMATPLYFGILPLGGPMQIQYLTEIHIRLVRFLEDHGAHEEAQALATIPVDRGYVAGPAVAFTEHADGRVVPASAVDIMLAGGLTMAHLEILGQATMADLHAVSIPSIHRFTIGPELPAHLSLRGVLERHGLEELILPRFS